MSEPRRRQIDVDQDREEAEEDARQALLDRAADLSTTRGAWHRIQDDNRAALAEPTEDEES